MKDALNQLRRSVSVPSLISVMMIVTLPVRRSSGSRTMRPRTAHFTPSRAEAIFTGGM